MLRAYVVYPGDSPYAGGCVLVFAETAGKAKNLVVKKGPWISSAYTDLNCRRRKKYDEYAGDTPRIIETNEELPEGAPIFFDDIPF